LLFSLVGAFSVFFPERYRINNLSFSGSQATFEAIVGCKLTAMRIAAFLLTPRHYKSGYSYDHISSLAC